MSKVGKVIGRGLIGKGSYPHHFPTSIQYETIMGSTAYGCATPGKSDFDIYGFCIPEKHVIFPHLKGYIPNFGQQPEKFEQWQYHHIKDQDTEYDFVIYNIVKYFQLVMENNPNMVDSLFTPLHCVTHCSAIGQMVRDNRKLFLHKGSYHKYRGYAFQQLHKIKTKGIPTNPNRLESVEKYGVDVKFLYHIVRLANEMEQILEHGDLDLDRDKEQLKAIRRGEWSVEDVQTYFEKKETLLEELYVKSPLQHSPPEDKIRQLLLDCLEHHYGSIADSIINPDEATHTLREIANLLHQRGY